MNSRISGGKCYNLQQVSTKIARQNRRETPGRVMPKTPSDELLEEPLGPPVAVAPVAFVVAVPVALEVVIGIAVSAALSRSHDEPCCKI